MMENNQELNAALSEVERLRESLDRIGIGGNHLASALIHILGAGDDTFPPYKTDFKEAEKVIADPIRMDLWTCWAVMMRERDAVRTDSDTPPPDPTSIDSILSSVARDDAERTIERLLGPATPDPRDEALERLAAFAAEYGGDATGCNPQILLDKINAAIHAARGGK